MALPTSASELVDGLDGFEALVTRGLTRWNHTPATKRLVSLFVHHVSHRWIQGVIGNRLEVHGAEHVRGLDPERGILLVANHRTFWDMYVGTSVLTAHSPRVRDLFFPVRRRFFYTHPLGVLLNFAVSGGSMWPPMASGFDRRRRDLVAIDALARTLDRPRTLAGIHPEGTRNKRAEPLDLLPAKGGAGRLVRALHPEAVVVPFFMCGLTDDFVGEVRRNFRRPDRRGPPVQIAFGEPRPASRWAQADGPPASISRALLDHVRELGASMPRVPVRGAPTPEPDP